MYCRNPHFSATGTFAALNAVSETFGPGRLHRCKELQVAIHFPAASTVGTIRVEASDTQDFTGTPKTVVDIAWTAANKTETTNITGIYGFIRLKVQVAVDGGGSARWTVQGN